MADGRGSGPQRHLHELLIEAYPIYTIVYEQVIPELNQRFDLFVLELGIAIEYDGRQHDNFVEHFHKDMNGYISGLQKDTKKNNFCEENGIKLIRLKGDVYDMTKNNLLDTISSVEYPDAEYDYTIFNKKSRRLEKDREYRKERYQKFKKTKKV